MYVIRKINTFDEREVCEHFSRLSDEERRQRFGHYISDESIVAYVKDINWFKTILIGYYCDEKVIGVGELQYIEPYPAATAEFAVTVEQDYQNQGLGSKIFDQLSMIARNRLIKSIYMKCLIDNIKARNFAKKHDAAFSSDSGELNGWIKVPNANYFSLIDEVLLEASIFFNKSKVIFCN